MTLKIYLDGEDVTDEAMLDGAATMPSGPGHLPTEYELRKTLFGEPVPIDHAPGHDCWIANCIRWALAKPQPD